MAQRYLGGKIGIRRSEILRNKWGKNITILLKECSLIGIAIND